MPKPISQQPIAERLAKDMGNYRMRNRGALPNAVYVDQVSYEKLHVECRMQVNYPLVYETKVKKEGSWVRELHLAGIKLVAVNGYFPTAPYLAFGEPLR